MTGGVLASRHAYGLTRFLSGRRDDACDLDRMRDKEGLRRLCLMALELYKFS